MVHYGQKTFTTNQSVPAADNQDSLKYRQRGLFLLQDIHLIEKLANFDGERIPERVVCTKVAGAHGYFMEYKTMEKLSHNRK